ncbi:MAG: protein kinase domain-containing protein, partial [Candidatus Xenobia bacterium]
MQTIPRSFRERFEIADPLMHCRFSTLYRGRDRSRGEPVVVRALQLPAAADLRHVVQQQFLREGEVLRRLAHRNLPHVVGVLQDDQGLYTVLEPFDGHSIDYVVKHLPGLPSQKLLLRWLDQVAAALEYLHQQEPPIIYRDLSPTSILLTEDA